MYYIFAHFSKFITPGSVQIEVTGELYNVEFVAFKTTLGDIVIVLQNRHSTCRKVTIEYEEQFLNFEIDANSVITALFR